MTDRPAVNPSRLSRSGVRGVSRAVKKTRRNGHEWGYVVFRVVWCPEPGHRMVKDFYVRGGDEQEALERAAAFRREREREMADADAGERIEREVRAAVPRDLPPELRRDVEQEIALALFEGRLRPDALDACAVRDVVRGVGRSHGDRRRHVSLEHMIGGSLRLVDVLEG